MICISDYYVRFAYTNTNAQIKLAYTRDAFSSLMNNLYIRNIRNVYICAHYVHIMWLLKLSCKFQQFGLYVYICLYLNFNVTFHAKRDSNFGASLFCVRRSWIQSGRILLITFCTLRICAAQQVKIEKSSSVNLFAKKTIYPKIYTRIQFS